MRRTEPGAAARQLKRFRSDFASSFIVINVITRHFDLAMDLAVKHRLRGADTLQLAVALDTAQVAQTPPVFVAADLELLTAARDEGFAVDNPNEHP